MSKSLFAYVSLSSWFLQFLEHFPLPLLSPVFRLSVDFHLPNLWQNAADSETCGCCQTVFRCSKPADIWLFLFCPLEVLPPGILPVRGSNELLVSRVMEGKVTDWARARRAAEMIRSRDYTTKDGMVMGSIRALWDLWVKSWKVPQKLDAGCQSNTC